EDLAWVILPKVGNAAMRGVDAATRYDDSRKPRKPVVRGIEGLRSLDRRMLDTFTHIRDVKSSLDLSEIRKMMGSSAIEV
ncbi:MAG: hypothetical protein AAF560_29105, partial [Acidobacteriota bacterium]